MFTIPQDLSVFSVAGLQDMLRVATEELRTLRAGIPDPAQVDDDTLARMRDLHTFGTAAQAELDARDARAAEFASLELTERPAPTAFQAAYEQAQQVTETAPAAVVIEEGVIVASTQTTGTSIVPSFSQVAQLSPEPVLAPTSDIGFLGEFHSLIAANELENVHGGSEMESWRQFAEAFVSRSRTYMGASPMRHPVATIQRNFNPEFILTEEMSDGTVDAVLRRAGDETRLEGGSLVAANGWCAPSETLYSTCLQISTDGLLSLPEVIARRGGIRHNQGIEFDSIFGTGAGFNILTEAQVIADVTKTCVEIPCPPFVDDRLDVSVLCLTGSILQNRAYPEFVETFVRGALATFAHFQNREIIADIVAGSGAAIAISTVDPWASALSVISQVLGAVEMAVVDIRYRLRLPQSATLEVVFPYWLKALFRQDFSRRTGFDGVGLADSMIDAWMAQRGVR